ncbi:MAG: phosphate ABC transporter substrate-binding protein, partial [Burkholderiales bacterium]|nr:phosphate ABC transporter substrate-binding protein [Burkholderiales bacterium]
MRSIAALFFLVFHTGLTLAAPDTAIRVGVVPTLSAKALMTSYQPLRVYLERELQRPVEMVSSPDFRRFQHDTLAG